jgi:DNA-binding MarR family transcriptional regulator
VVSLNLSWMNEKDIAMLIFVLKKRQVSYSEFRDFVVNEVESKRIYAKATFSKRINAFAKLGLLKKKLDEATGRPVYYIPDDAKTEVIKLKLRKEAKSKIDDISDLYDLIDVKMILEMRDEEIHKSEEVVKAKISHLELFKDPEFWEIIKDDFYAFMVDEISGEEYSARLNRKAESFLKRRSQKPE